MASVRSLRTLLLIGAATLLCGTSAAFAFDFGYTVGGDGACNFSTIQAAVAAAVLSGESRINIAVNQTYTAQAIVINDKNLTLIGGYPNCSSTLAPSGNSTISGAGNGTHSVIAIGGASNVDLENLTITGGHLGSGQTGGGIYFGGSGTLTLTSSTVTNNSANFGGGINVNGFNGSAIVTINGPNTFITGNTATDSGGGIRIEGNATLYMLNDGIFVGQNTATGGNGGGLEIVDPATGYIGSPGTGTGVIYDNFAVNGGGVAVDTGSGDGLNATLWMFSTDPTRPARISNNAASAHGGGIYLGALSSLSGDVADGLLCGHDYRIDGNAAMDGSAIYADSDSDLTGDEWGARLYLGPDACGHVDPSLGQVACALDASCHTIDGNLSIDINNDNQPTDGATIVAQPSTEVGIDRLLLRGNSGGYAVRQHGDSSADLSNCLFTKNQLRHELVFGDAGASMHIDNCTFADDLIGAEDVINSDSSLALTNSIIAEAGTKTLHFTGDAGNLQVAYVVTNDNTLPSVDPRVFVGDPMFIDAVHDDYRLIATATAHSPAIDFAPPEEIFDNHDIAGRPHDLDVASIEDRFGVRDLGAYEMQPITDRIFADAFGDPVYIAY